MDERTMRIRRLECTREVLQELIAEFEREQTTEMSEWRDGYVCGLLRGYRFAENLITNLLINMKN